ncbi:MAG: choice-of-anchor tandem repeat GloVer-containing protein [Terriglobales bacterium]
MYGTAWKGGQNGGGSIYEVSKTGKLSAIYDFCSQPNCADGQAPTGNLEYHAGKVYSTTSQGGAFNQGVVFELAPK